MTSPRWVASASTACSTEGARYETERRLLYVACTRAREHLLLAGVTPTSEYLADFTS
jgi:ATP-dependent exoDNAse (exonuclease V) beta subunit